MLQRIDEGLFDDKGKQDKGLLDDEGNDEGIFNEPQNEEQEMRNESDTTVSEYLQETSPDSEELQETDQEVMREETGNMQQDEWETEDRMQKNEAAVLDDTDYYENTYDVWDEDDNDLLDKNEYNLGYDYSYGDYVVSDFNSVDTDGDGYVDYTEYETSVADTDMFNEWDMDKDQTLSDNEISRMVFNNWDYDNSNFIEKKEWEEFKDYYLKK